MTVPGNTRLVGPVVEGVMSEIVSLGKVVPVAGRGVSPPDRAVFGFWGPQCIQLWAVPLG